MKIWKFLLYTIFGSAIWNTVLVLLGKKLGDSWETVVNVFNEFSHIILILLIILCIVGIWWFYAKKDKKKK